MLFRSLQCAKFGVPTENAEIYVTHFPCLQCAKQIIQSGIKEIIYMSDKYADTDSVKASKAMFDMVGVKYHAYEPVGRKIEFEL